jgi:predicted nucleotidyltransferase
VLIALWVFANTQPEYAWGFVKQAMSQLVESRPVTPDDLAQLASQLQSIFEKHRILRAIVFGSLARGEASRHSDLDLIVVQATDKRFLDRYDDLLREIAQAVPGRDVDLLIYTPQELGQMVDRPFIARALREGKVIYESEQEPLSG